LISPHINWENWRNNTPILPSTYVSSLMSSEKKKKQN